MITKDQVNEFLVANKIDFDVSLAPTPHPILSSAETGYFTSYRPDTQAVFAQGLSSIWRPIQNREAFELISDLSEMQDLKMAKAYSFHGGSEVCVQISLGEMKIGSNDRIGKFVSFINSHDGSKSMALFCTPYRWWCKNQINASFNRAQKAKSIISIKHTTNVGNRLLMLSNSLNIINGAFEETEKVYNLLAERKINANYARDILHKLFPIEEDASARSKSFWERKMSDISLRLDGEKDNADTAWGLYNAIQGNIQHFGHESDSKMKSVLYGNKSQEAENVMNEIIKMTSIDYVPTGISDEIDSLVS